jgi:hypothetical protein
MADPVGRRLDAAWVIRMGLWGARSLALVLVLALLFTMVNVATFAAAGHPVDSFQWWIAWLLDPMASITMGTAIVFEGLLAGYGRHVGWLTATKWYAGLCTWAMNIWVSLTSRSLAGVLLHSVAPGLVLLLAEAAPRVRQHMAEIVHELRQDTPGQSIKLPGPDHTAVELPAATYRRVEPARPSWTSPPPPRQPEPAAAAPVGVPSAALSAAVDSAPVMNQKPATAASVATPQREEPSWVPVDTSPVPAGDDDLIERVRQLVTESTAAGRPMGRRAMAKQLDASEHRVRVALELVGTTTGPALNGTATRSKPPASGRGAP